MRTTEDAVRSVRRYVASALGSPPWRVRLTMTGRFKRPAALVQLPIPSPVTPSGVDTAAITQQMFIQLFPEIGKTPDEDKILAERAVSVLTDAFLLGIPDAHDESVHGFRERIPLWDYTDAEGNPLPIEGEGGIATKRLPRDYLRLLPGWSFQTMPMASDEQLYTAVCDLRVQWFRNARLPLTGQVLREVQLSTNGDTTIIV